MKASLIPYRNTNQIKHYNVCYSFEVETRNIDNSYAAEHKGFELNFTTNTTLTLNFRNKIHRITPKNFTVFNGREKHTHLYFKEPHMKCYSLVIMPEYINKLFKDLDLDANEILFSQFHFKISEEIKHLLRLVFTLRHTPEASQISFDCIVTELLINLLLQFEHSHSKRIKKIASSGYFPDNIYKSKMIIRDSLLEKKFNLDHIANCIGLSKFHFIRSFKQITGFTPIKYLAIAKTDFIKSKLIQTNDSIINIAYNAGYNDLSVFNRSFKKCTGLSPSTYRNKYQYKTAIFA